MDWDKRYSEGDTPWDHGFAAPAIDEVIAVDDFPSDAEVLVLGCGRGHDVRAFAASGFSTTGLDLSGVVIQSCQAQMEQMDGREGGHMDFIQGDLFDSALSDQKRYDVIWEHTCFCSIPLNHRRDYVEAVHRLLKQGGVLVGLFFIDTGHPPGEGPPFCADQEELHQLFGERFTLQWERKPQRSYESRIDREWLMCWRSVGNRLDSPPMLA